MSETHFEVLVCKGSNWSIQGVHYGAEKALQDAKAQIKTGRYNAVKVMRNQFDAETGIFEERQVFSHGSEAKKGKGFEDDGTAAFCWRVEDIYSYEGRLTLRRLIADELERWRITPIELIHSASHVMRFEDTGTLLQRVVQRVAIVQCQETDKSVQDRMKELFDLGTLASQQLQGDFKAKRVPTIEPRSLASVIEGLRGNGRANYFLSCGLAEYLKEAASWRGKLERLVALLQLSSDDLLVKSTDGFIAEILGSPSAIKDIFGPQANLAAALTLMVELRRGQAKLDSPGDDRIAPQALATLNALLAAERLPFTKIELGKRIIRDLAGTKPLTDGKPLVESQAIKALHKAMIEPDGKILGEAESWDAFCNRCARLLSTDAVAMLLEGVIGPRERADLLLEIEPNILGPANKRKLGDHLTPFIINPHHEPAYLQSPGTTTERLERIERLQRRILASELLHAHRKKMGEHLDGFAMRILQETQLFERLRKSSKTVVEKAMVILRLCAGGAFTQGRALETARGEARLNMKASDFIDMYLAGSKDNKEMASRLMEFQRLLQAAGLSADGFGFGGSPSAPAAEPAVAQASA
jgi:hypothetical protein